VNGANRLNNIFFLWCVWGSWLRTDCRLPIASLVSIDAPVLVNTNSYKKYGGSARELFLNHVAMHVRATFIYQVITIFPLYNNTENAIHSILEYTRPANI